MEKLPKCIGYQKCEEYSYNPTACVGKVEPDKLPTGLPEGYRYMRHRINPSPGTGESKQRRYCEDQTACAVFLQGTKLDPDTNIAYCVHMDDDGDCYFEMPAAGKPAFEEVPGYESLLAVLLQAYDQAARGKGVERHANGLPFVRQRMIKIDRAVKGGFCRGQAIKKIEESQGQDVEGAVKNLLGAINYIAGEIMRRREGV